MHTTSIATWGLPMTMAAVLALVWRQVPSVHELTRVLARIGDRYRAKPDTQDPIPDTRYPPIRPIPSDIL